jgi:hypothetical protein
LLVLAGAWLLVRVDGGAHLPQASIAFSEPGVGVNFACRTEVHVSPGPAVATLLWLLRPFAFTEGPKFDCTNSTRPPASKNMNAEAKTSLSLRVSGRVGRDRVGLGGEGFLCIIPSENAIDHTVLIHFVERFLSVVARYGADC